MNHRWNGGDEQLSRGVERGSAIIDIALYPVAVVER